MIGEGQLTTKGFGGLAVGPDDEVYVVDGDNSRVAVFSPDGVVGQSHELLATSSADEAKAACEASGRHLARVESISNTNVTEAEVLADALIRFGHAAGWTGYENRLPGDTFVWPGSSRSAPAPGPVLSTKVR